MRFWGAIWFAVAGLGVGCPAQCEIIDQLAATVAGKAITWSEVAKEGRLEAFFNRQPQPGWTRAAGSKLDPEFRAVLERVIQQKLVQHEMGQTHFPAATDQEAEKWLEQQGTGDPPSGLLREDLIQYGRRILDTLRFVDARFRSGLRITPEQAETYYEGTLLPDLWLKGLPTPDLEQVRGQIEQTLLDQRVNELLDQWMRELRRRLGVRILEPARTQAGDQANPKPGQPSNSSQGLP